MLRTEELRDLALGDGVHQGRVLKRELIREILDPKVWGRALSVLSGAEDSWKRRRGICVGLVLDH